MSTLEQKMIALLASTNIEGEALAAWRKLRERKPEGNLFSPEPVRAQRPANVGAVALHRAQERGRQIGYAEGFAKGVESIKDQMIADYDTAVSRGVQRALQAESFPRQLLRLAIDLATLSLPQAVRLFVWFLKVYVVVWVLSIFAEVFI